MRIAPPSLPPHHSGPATRDFRPSSGCARPPSPTTPVLCHGPVRWSPPNGSGGGAPTHVPLQLTSPSSPSRGHLGVPSASSPVFVWSLRCRFGHSCRGYDLPHWIVYQGGIQNGYPANFICNASAPPTQETADVNSPEEEQEKEPLVVIPYVAGMSEDIRRVCRKFNIRVVFKSGQTLRSMLTKVKDTLPPDDDWSIQSKRRQSYFPNSSW